VPDIFPHRMCEKSRPLHGSQNDWKSTLPDLLFKTYSTKIKKIVRIKGKKIQRWVKEILQMCRTDLRPKQARSTIDLKTES
jgi:transposase-like protein